MYLSFPVGRLYIYLVESFWDWSTDIVTTTYGNDPHATRVGKIGETNLDDGSIDADLHLHTVPMRIYWWKKKITNRPIQNREESRWTSFVAGNWSNQRRPLDNSSQSDYAIALLDTSLKLQPRKITRLLSYLLCSTNDNYIIPTVPFNCLEAYLSY
jgi:hypothetical protein